MYKYLATAFCTVSLIGCGGGNSGTETVQQTQPSLDPVVNTLTGAVTPTLPATLLPATIEAEDFINQSGIRVGQTTDSGGSDYIGWITNSDYTDYSIDVPATGIYTLTARVAARDTTGSVSFSANGEAVGSLTVTPTGDWDSWKSISTTLALSSGIQTLQAVYSGTGNALMNINWFRLESADTLTTANELDNSRWVAYSNFNTADTYMAIDGNDTTRWTTQEVQSNDQYFTIEFNNAETFDRISLDSSGSSGDYPRSYLVQVSDNGSDWIEVAAGTGTTNGKTIIDFDTQTATQLRVSQLGQASASWWSIHELKIYANSSDTPVTQLPQADWNIDNLPDLYTAVQNSNQHIIVKPGLYSISSLPERHFIVSGNNNEIDLTDVTIDFPVDQTSEPHFLFTGSDNIFRNGTLENTYPGGQQTVIDYVSYNQDRDGLANGAGVHMKIEGDGNSIFGTKMIIKGSFPYGYGSYFGIGSNNVFGLSKRGGIDITPGKNTTIDGIEMDHQAYGHGIFFGEGSDNLVIRNVRITGAVRPTNEMLAEGFGSLPYLSGYLDEEGIAIPPDEVESLAEDGIRAYGGSGSVTVENSVVSNMRGGIRLYLAGSAEVSNTTSLDNGLSNFNMPRGSTATDNIANFTYGPVNDFRLGRSDQKFDITILPSPNAVGAHNIADVQGNNHELVFRRADGPEDTTEDRVISVTGNDSFIRNETEYGIVLESGTTGNTVVSAGPVMDLGTNDVTRIDLDL